MDYPGKLAEYLDLMSRFANADISADEFERLYLNAFKSDDNIYEEDIFNILDSLFAAVDSYCSDESLIDELDINEKQLLDAVNVALNKLQMQ